MRFFKKNNGAISVFLVIVLVPCLLFAGLTIDAARIYTSKVVISDAGQMALNAGLSQYQKSLHDKYGLLVMDKNPASMQSELQGYFDASLNGSGIEGDYDQILHLLTISFETANIEASNICRSEVEKQQIIEYMKYRAPVCLTELVLEKFDQIKETRKITEAMEKEMDFADAMEQCQDSMEQAKAALDVLNEKLNSFPTQTTIDRDLGNIQVSYQVQLSKALLMLAAVKNYTQKASDTDIGSLVQSYVNASKNVKLSSPTDKDTFTAYINCLYYDNAITDLGGIHQLNQSGSSDGENSETTDYSSLVTDYNNAKSSIASYPEKLKNLANQVINDGYSTLHEYYTDARTITSQANTAHKKLLIVKEDFDFAKQKWNDWSAATDQLSAGETKDSMQSEINTYQNFFDTGDGSKDAYNLEILIQKVREDKDYFNELSSILTEEKFFSISIAIAAVSNQYNTYYSKATVSAGNFIVASQDVYVAEENARIDFAENYEHTIITTSFKMHRIEDDEFYLKIQEYSKTTVESEIKKTEINGKVDEGAGSAENVENDSGYNSLTFNWSSVSEQLISSGGSSSVDDSVTDISGSVSDRSSRKSLLKKYEQSIKAASSFLDGVDRILADNIENLYVAEYAMQMFSCYTSDKNSKGEKLSDDQILSISGYKLSENKAYKSEIEYILWGNNSSKQNVKNTVMMIFGVRMLLNSIFTFSNQIIRTTAQASATLIAGATPYLVPIVKILIQFAFAAVETGNDITKIREGKGVTIIKTESSWATAPFGKDNTSGLTFNYEEYLRIFLNINMIAGKEDYVLKRIADCIQVNTSDFDLKKGYTMIGINASVSTNTTFIGPLSNWAGSGGHKDRYNISYHSLLGY